MNYNVAVMNILQLNSVCGVGSTGRIVMDMHNVLKSKGYNSTVAYGRETLGGADKEIYIGNRIDKYLHVIYSRLLDAHGYGSFKATKNFIKKIGVLNPDIIHLHNIHGYYLNIEILFEYLVAANKPVVWTFHDCWPITGHCTYFDYIGCDKWKTGCYECPIKAEYPKSILLDASKENYRKKNDLFAGVKDLTIVTPSRWLSLLVEASFLKKYPIKIINNGIDLSVFNPVESDFRVRNNLFNRFIILGVSSIWGERKGLNYFVRLAKDLKPDQIIVLVGVSDKIKKELPEEIVCISKTNNTRELAEIYSAADVFVNPTLEDNFPTTNLEALACGTPIITFDSGGSAECVDERCGIVVRRGDYDALSSAVVTVQSRGKQFYASQCLSRAKRLYDKNDRFQEYVRLYESKMR